MIIIKYAPIKIAGIASCNSSCIYAVAAAKAVEFSTPSVFTADKTPMALAPTKQNITAAIKGKILFLPKYANAALANAGTSRQISPVADHLVK